MISKLKGLGRGLDALLDASDGSTAQKESQATVALDRLTPGRYQPRTKMDDASLQDLAASIRKQGMMQPILVRPVAGGRYEIIAGERRWRASRIAGLQDVPVIIRDVPDATALAMALIENIQRENLNALEEAQGVQRLIGDFKLTHQEAADAIGRSRAATTNLLRLLSLEKAVQRFLFEGRLDMGHGRALLGLSGRRQEEVARRVADRGMSVRETEKLVDDIVNPKARARGHRIDRDIQRLEEELSGQLGTTVAIRPGKKGTGRLIISYMSNAHLDELLAKIRSR